MANAITYQRVVDLSVTVNLKFDKAFNEYVPVYKDIAPTIKSNGASNTYPLGNYPTLREWVGDRIVNQIGETKYNLVNKKYEATLEIPVESIEDDNTGFYTNQAEAMGKEASSFPDTLLASLIEEGFTSGLSFDDVAFFGLHNAGAGNEFNNLQDGLLGYEPWVVLDNSKSFPAFFYQERKAFEIQKPKDLTEYTFWKDKYVYGIRGRGAMGYGLPQLAFASKGLLTGVNFDSIQRKMLGVKKVNGTNVGAMPTHIIVGPANYSRAKQLFENQINSFGASNSLYGAVKVVLLRYINTPTLSLNLPSLFESESIRVGGVNAQNANINTIAETDTTSNEDNKLHKPKPSNQVATTGGISGNDK